MKKNILLSLLIIALISGTIFLALSFKKGGGHNLDTKVSFVENAVEELSANNQLTDKKEEKMQAIIITNFGEIKLELFEEDAPNTVANFVKLSNSGFYDGTKFHRVIPNFMIQGGDPLTKNESESNNWGRGGPGYTFNDEIHSNNHNLRMTIGMANAGANTNGSQFFINTADNSFLDPKHTVFGRVVEGAWVVKEIENNKTGSGDRPIKPVIIESIKVY